MSTTTIGDTETLNQIIAHHPQTLAVFQRFGLDTCCGGSLTLHDAAEHHGLDLQAVIAALRANIEEAD